LKSPPALAVLAESARVAPAVAPDSSMPLRARRAAVRQPGPKSSDKAKQ